MLSKSAKFLNEIPRIDYGGCGISAYMLYSHLKKQYPNAEIEIVMCYPTYNDGELTSYFEDDLTMIEAGNLRNVKFCDHIILKYKGIFFDHTGIVVQDYIETTEKILISLEELLRLIIHGNWCSDFNRNIYLPKIEERFGIKLEN